MAASTLYDELMTFDDLIATLTLSDDNRREMVRDYAADAIDETLKEAVLDAIIRQSRSDFAPEIYLSKLNEIIAKEQDIVSGLHIDIGRIQRGIQPTYYLDHIADDVIVDMVDAEDMLMASTLIGLHILLSESIISHARKAQGALMTFAQSEANRRYYYTISLKSPDDKELYDKLTTKGLIDSSFETFQYFFAHLPNMAEPTKKMSWKGKSIELVCLILTLSRNHPEWAVTERAFGISAKSLKASASRLYNNIGRNKRINDFIREFLK